MRDCCWLADLWSVVKHSMYEYKVCSKCGRWYRVPGSISRSREEALTADQVLGHLAVDEWLMYWSWPKNESV
jgi:hypothetical protein